MRVIPLVISREKMDKAGDAIRQEMGKADPVFASFCPEEGCRYQTGSEVYKGRIKDTFTPVLEEKLGHYPVTIISRTVCDDDPQMVTDAIRGALEMGADLVLVLGG